MFSPTARPLHKVTTALLVLLVGLVNVEVMGVAQSAQKPKGLRIAVIEGEDAVNIIQQKTAIAPVVEVRDENDLPVAGVPVTFTVSGNTATFAGGAQTLTVTSNAAGRAAVNSLTAVGNGPVQINVSATFLGQTAAVTITQTNYATTAQASQAGASGGGGAGGAAGVGGAATGAGGGLSTLAIVGITGGAVAGGLVAVNAVRGGNTAPAFSGVTATPTVALLGTDTPIAFSAQVTDQDNDALTFDWDFGDGGTSNEASPSHVFRSAGAFTVRVTVSDGEDSATTQTVITVKTLTGVWGNPIAPNQGGRLTLTQNGTSVTGSSLLTGGPFLGAVDVECPLSGTVRPSPPRIVLISPACSSPTRNIFSAEYLLDPDADVDGVGGVVVTTELRTQVLYRRQ